MLQCKEETKVLCNFVTVLHDFINNTIYYDTWEAGMKGNNYFSTVF